MKHLMNYLENPQRHPQGEALDPETAVPSPSREAR